MSKYVCKWVGKGIGDPSSKYAFDRDGKQFEADIQRHMERAEKLYSDFKKWMITNEVIPDECRGLFIRFYDEFIREDNTNENNITQG